MTTKNNIFEEYLNNYLKGTKEQKSGILSHVSFVTRMHRKACIRKFKTLQMSYPNKPELRGRSEYYGANVTPALKELWEIGNKVCGELLHPVLIEYINTLQRDQMWHYPTDITQKLKIMSLATMKRRIGDFMKTRSKKAGLSATKPSHLKQIIPTFQGPWKDFPPGYGQIDTVLHNDTLLGDSVYSLQYTDTATCWSIQRAQWNKTQTTTVNGLSTIKRRLPFPLVMVHPDTGSEFINHTMYHWCKANQIDMTRSRPGQKNDNMHVEERNGHIIRRMVGYLPLTCPEAVKALNAYYDIMTVYLNHFIAIRRMIKKERVGSQIKRSYELIAKTPYQRVLAHPAIPRNIKGKLRLEHAQLNPAILKQEMDKRLKILYATQQRHGTKLG